MANKFVSIRIISRIYTEFFLRKQNILSSLFFLYLIIIITKNLLLRNLYKIAHIFVNKILILNI